MEYQTTVVRDTFETTFHTGLKAVGRFFSGVGQAMRIGAQANARLEKVQRLQQMTDADLKAIGLERSEITRHIFRDLYHI